MGTTKVRRQFAAIVVAGGVLGSAAGVVTASPAGAHEDGYHLCDLTGRQDDTPIADVIHHYVEPLGVAGVHKFNCDYITGTERALADPDTLGNTVTILVQIVLGALGGG